MTAPVPGKFSLFSVMDGAARTIVRDFPSYFKLALASFLFCWGFSAVQSGTEPGAGATSARLAPNGSGAAPARPARHGSGKARTARHGIGAAPARPA